MAGCRFHVSRIDKALTAAYLRLLFLKAGNNQVEMGHVHLSCDDLTSLPPLVRFTIGGTASPSTGGTVITPEKLNPDVQHTVLAISRRDDTDVEGSFTMSKEFRLGPGGLILFQKREFYVGASEIFTVWVKHATETAKWSGSIEAEE